MVRDAAEVRSDSEEAPARPGRKARRQSSTPPRETEVTKNGEEEPEEDPEEEYEIERIIQAKKGVLAAGRMAYLIKWKGYSDKDNSWVDEDDLQADELKDEFWAQEAPKKPRGRPSGSARKSDASTRRSSNTTLKREPSESKLSNTNSKRGRKQETEADDASDEEMDAEVPEAVTKPPKKRTKTTTKKSNRPALPASRTVSPYDMVTIGGESARASYDSTIMDKYMAVKDWSKIVEKVETVEQMENQDLMVYFVTKSGERGVQNSLTIRKHCPGKLLQFYEDHLRWKKDAEADK